MVFFFSQLLLLLFFFRNTVVIFLRNAKNWFSDYTSNLSSWLVCHFCICSIFCDTLFLPRYLLDFLSFVRAFLVSENALETSSRVGKASCVLFDRSAQPREQHTHTRCPAPTATPYELDGLSLVVGWQNDVIDRVRGAFFFSWFFSPDFLIPTPLPIRVCRLSDVCGSSTHEEEPLRAGAMCGSRYNNNTHTKNGRWMMMENKPKNMDRCACSTPCLLEEEKKKTAGPHRERSRPREKKQKIKEGRNKKERHRTSLAWCVKKRAAVGLAFLDESFCLLESKNEFRFYLNWIFLFLSFFFFCIKV